MSKPRSQERLRAYWENAQPLFAIGQRTGTSLTQTVNVEQLREIQHQIEQAYLAGWNDAAEEIEEIIKEKMK